jgi:hypothetical protein
MRALVRCALSSPMLLAAACGSSVLTTDPGAGGAPPGGGGAATSATTVSSAATTSSTMTSSTTTSTTTEPPPLLDPGVRLAHGPKPWCIKEAQGTVICDTTYWGDPIGPGLATLPGIEDAEAVVRAIEYGCVLHQTGAVSCWGFSHKGQLGLAVSPGESSDVPVLLPGVQLVKIAAGHHSVCGIEPSGQAVCWGGQYSGPLGDPAVVQSQTPVNVLGVPDAIDIDESYEEACAVRASGQVLCWRQNEAPHEVVAVTDASRVTVSYGRVCAVVGAGSVVCWDSFEEEPGAILGIDDASQVAVGPYHACARRASGLVTCWNNAGSTASDFWPASIEDAVDIAMGDSGDRVCAVRSTGDVVCWGQGEAPVPFPG